MFFKRRYSTVHGVLLYEKPRNKCQGKGRLRLCLRISSFLSGNTERRRIINELIVFLNLIV